MKKLLLTFVLLFSVPTLAGFTEAINYFDNQQYAQAFSEFKPLADKDDERAQYYIAYMYLNGFGVVQNTELGLDYLKRSAEQEYEKSLSLLAYFYSTGKYLEQDKKKALDLYLKAAEYEDDDALLNLGVIYYTADGVAHDTQKAIDYFQRVDLVSNPIVGRYLADIYLYQEDDKLRKKAKDLYLLAASNGDMGSFQALAAFLQQEKNNPKGLEEAITYYTYAASQGYAPSQYTLGILYANGTGVPKNMMKAYAWFSLAANQGLAPAIEAQKELEDSLTFSELDYGRGQIIEIQQTVIGKIESPLKDFKLKAPQETKKNNRNQNRPSRRRRGR